MGLERKLGEGGDEQGGFVEWARIRQVLSAEMILGARVVSKYT